MDPLVAKWQQTEQKVLKLVEQFHHLKTENISLKQKIQNHNTTKTTNIISENNQESSINRSTESAESLKPFKLKQVKKDIEQAIKCIDDCLDWMSKY